MSDVDASWSQEVTKLAHDRVLSIGARKLPQASIDGAVAAYDWSISERCGEHNECDQQRGFLNALKAVFGIEYTIDEDNMPNDTALACTRLKNAGINGGIIKTAALDTTYMKCP
jgi:hypothetical protein